MLTCLSDLDRHYHMRFKDWISREGISLGQAARRIGLPNATAVRRYMLGDHVPRPGIMTRIYCVSGGAVTPNDFYDLPPLLPASEAPVTASSTREAA